MNPQVVKSESIEGPGVSPGGLEGYDESDKPFSSPYQLHAESTAPQPYKPPKTKAQQLAVPLTVLAILFIVGSIAFILLTSIRQMTPDEESKFNQQSVDLSQVNNDNTTRSKASGQLAVNGGLSVSGSFQVTPNEQPVNPNTGQIFYDKKRNALGYYNGSEFVYMQGNNPTPAPIQNIDNSISTTTIINNATQLAPPSVLLQQGTPATTQLGNFNIDGTGTVSSLVSGTATIATLNSTNASIDSGNISSLTSGSASINTGDITNLSSDTAAINVGNINTINSDVANVTTGTIDTANIAVGNIDTANIEVGNVETANIETGNIDTANVNLVNTGQIESNGQLLTINKFEEIPGGQAATAGYTNIGSSTTRPVGMFGTKVTTGSSGGPLDSLSVYIGGACQLNTISGCSGPATNASFQVGIYSDDGDLVSNKPQTRLAEAGPFYANDGDFILNSWNTLDMPSLPIQPFTSYWIVFYVPGSWSSYGAIDFKYKTNSSDGNSYTVTDQSWCSWSAWGMPANGPLATCFGNTGPYYSKQDLSAYLNYTTDPSTGGAGAMFSLSPIGAAAFRNTTDSLNAFKVQNAASATTIFNIDTYNMRVAVGKSSADYLLDIGNGDVNMVSGRSLRFGGTKVLTASTTATQLAGGTISLQGATTLTSTATIQGAASFANTISVTGATTLNGATTVSNTLINRVSSATAFTIQNASSANLFVANTSTMTISITGTDTTFANLTLNNAHFKSTQTTAPTIATPTSCGTTPTAIIATGSTDSAGSFTITTGTGGTSSTCDAIITFRRAYSAAPKSIIVVGKGNASAAQRQIYVVSSTSTTFNVSFANSTGGANSTAYAFDYWVIE